MSGSANWEVNTAGDLITGTVHALSGFELNAGSLKQVFTSGNFTAVGNTRYTISGFSSTVTLPANQPVGTRIVLVGMSAVLTVQAPALNYFSFSLVSSTLGGTIFSLTQGAAVELEVALNAGQIQWNIVNFINSWQISRSPTPYIIDQLGNQTMPIVKTGIKRDNSTAVTVDVNNGQLLDFSGLKTIDFQNRKLYDTSGSHVQIDYSVPQVIDLSPLSAPQQNLVKLNQLSVYTAFQAPAGVVTLNGTNVNVTSTGCTSGSMVFLQALGAAPAGRLWAVPGTDNVSINSTASETSLSVAYWVVGQHS